jgi:hypothetical protein
MAADSPAISGRRASSEQLRIGGKSVEQRTPTSFDRLRWDRKLLAPSNALGRAQGPKFGGAIMLGFPMTVWSPTKCVELQHLPGAYDQRDRRLVMGKPYDSWGKPATCERNIFLFENGHGNPAKTRAKRKGV